MAKRKSKSNNLLIAGIVIAIVLIAFNFYISSQLKTLQQPRIEEKTPMMGKPMSRMSLTAFDEDKAREFMDKNGDGKCDACGMPIEQCIKSGMMQCSGMDPSATIGILGSQHIHADFKVYIEGKPVDFEPYAMDMAKMDAKITSSFIHVDKGAPAPEKTGDVIHMHATGIPLRLFFESIGMKLEGDCLQVDGEQHCGIKMYVNGQENTEYGEYVFEDLDKILITDGKGEDLEEQMKSITSFAEGH